MKTTKTTRPQVQNACGSCRQKKVKCTGKLPVCSRCAERGIECVYDVPEEGMTKTKHLRNQLSVQTRELERATAILRALQSGTESQAIETLAQLRTGQSMDHLLRNLPEIQGLPLNGVETQEDHGSQSCRPGSAFGPAMDYAASERLQGWQDASIVEVGAIQNSQTVLQGYNTMPSDDHGLTSGPSPTQDSVHSWTTFPEGPALDIPNSLTYDQHQHARDAYYN